MAGRKSRQTYKRTDRQVDRQTGGQTDSWTDRQVDRQTVGKTDDADGCGRFEEANTYYARFFILAP
jgi:hypothetical protein